MKKVKKNVLTVTRAMLEDLTAVGLFYSCNFITENACFHKWFSIQYARHNKKNAMNYTFKLFERLVYFFINYFISNERSDSLCFKATQRVYISLSYL